MAKIPPIALPIETSREYGRGLLRGVARYHHERGPWSIYFEPHGLNERPPSWLKNWRGDGILARIDDRRMADVILATGLPAVDVRGALENLPIPFVGLENRPIAQLGFEHLEHCGLQHFAFCGTPRGENPNQDRHCDLSVEQVKAAGKKCDVFLGGLRWPGTTTATASSTPSTTPSGATISARPAWASSPTAMATTRSTLATATLATTTSGAPTSASQLPAAKVPVQTLPFLSRRLGCSRFWW